MIKKIWNHDQTQQYQNQNHDQNQNQNFAHRKWNYKSRVAPFRTVWCKPGLRMSSLSGWSCWALLKWSGKRFQPTLKQIDQIKPYSKDLLKKVAQRPPKLLQHPHQVVTLLRAPHMKRQILRSVKASAAWQSHYCLRCFDCSKRSKIEI